MFTGLVTALGDISRAEFRRGRLRLDLRLPARWNVATGESVAVDGVCLTTAARRGRIASFDVVAETLDRTTLSGARKGGRVNLERALRAGDRMGGHFVSGHIDGVGKVVKIAKKGGDLLFTFSAPKRLMPEIAEKGSIAVDGISLTVAGVTTNYEPRTTNCFVCTIIPYTLSHTTLGDRKPGSRVNLETDILAKYVRRAAGARFR